MGPALVFELGDFGVELLNGSLDIKLPFAPYISAAQFEKDDHRLDPDTEGEGSFFDMFEPLEFAIRINGVKNDGKYIGFEVEVPGAVKAELKAYLDHYFPDTKIQPMDFLRVFKASGNVEAKLAALRKVRNFNKAGVVCMIFDAPEFQAKAGVTHNLGTYKHLEGKDFLSKEDAKLIGDSRFDYVQFADLSGELKLEAERAYANKSPGAKYDFKLEHYYYPVTKDGKLGNGRRVLAIKKTAIDDEKTGV